MLVYIHQYRPGDSGNARQGTDASVDRDPDSYFNVDDLPLEEWVRLERDGRELQRRARQFDEVTAVSVPEGDTDDDLPGRTIQLRVGGETEYVERAELVEVQDHDP